jgi:lysophospholipase L1-like esterase
VLLYVVGRELGEGLFDLQVQLRPRKVVAIAFFVGNDIVGKDTDRSPEQVVALFRQVLDVVRAKHPATPVFYIAVTPSGSRFAAWSKIKAGNRAVQAFCEATPHTYFIPTESAFLDAEGKRRDELFIADRLHLNADGYVRWGAIIKSHLDGVLGGALP